MALMVLEVILVFLGVVLVVLEVILVVNKVCFRGPGGSLEGPDNVKQSLIKPFKTCYVCPIRSPQGP